MSVIMTMLIQGDPDKLEGVAQANPDRIRGIAERAKGHGLIAHRFYGTDGQIMVIDEWPDPESFQAFFGEQGDEIQQMMDEVGVQAEPQVNFWRKLETQDDVGWDAG